MTTTTDSPKIAEFLIQDKEPQDEVLHRKLFEVNMRLFKENPHYKAIVLAACDYLSYCMDRDFSDYPKTKGISAANVGLPWNIVCVEINGERKIIINPRITDRSNETKIGKTNCGSFNLGEKVEVERPTWIQVVGFTEKGIEGGVRVTNGAGTVEHEIEHNLGITILDKNKALIRKREVARKKAGEEVSTDVVGTCDSCNKPATYKVTVGKSKTERYCEGCMRKKRETGMPKCDKCENPATIKDSVRGVLCSRCYKELTGRTVEPGAGPDPTADADKCDKCIQLSEFYDVDEEKNVHPHCTVHHNEWIKAHPEKPVEGVCCRCSKVSQYKITDITPGSGKTTKEYCKDCYATHYSTDNKQCESCEKKAKFFDLGETKGGVTPVHPRCEQCHIKWVDGTSSRNAQIWQDGYGQGQMAVSGSPGPADVDRATAIINSRKPKTPSQIKCATTGCEMSPVPGNIYCSDCIARCRKLQKENPIKKCITVGCHNAAIGQGYTYPQYCPKCRQSIIQPVTKTGTGP
jgi:peptide deformylase